ncbi:MAG: 50S ribosomal protein L11 methyltransferase [Venatoribacter sp.]
MLTGKFAQLEQALRLPDAKLEPTHLAKENLVLHLLHLANTEQQLSAAEIAYFWQKLPYWAFAWAGGRALAQWIEANPGWVQGKRVLDFGCGSALVGIASAKAGAKEVWVADLDDNALLAAQLNARANGVEIHIVKQQQWPQVDLLLASDVLYDISSSADLQTLMLNIPQWLLAESHFVKPNFVELSSLQRYQSSTLPSIGDFDEQIDIEIYCRARVRVKHL